MRLYPAIDIKGSKCVRLTQGDFDRETVYYNTPLEAAKYWESVGSKYIHIVDLDGSLEGRFINYDSLKAIADNTNLKIQFGGGIRSLSDVEQLLSIGVDRIVIGSLAIKDFDKFSEIVKKYPQNIVCAVDFKDGSIMGDGWTTGGSISVDAFVKKATDAGCLAFLATDISRDGMLSGPAFEAYDRLKSITSAEIIASGGISSLEDLSKLNALGLPSAIVGKAFYEEKFTFQSALEITRRSSC